MLKKALIPLFIFLFFLFVPMAVYLLEYSPIATASSEKVLYNMPYPGILPDSPIYFIKIIRDRVTEFLTRDNIKKAQLYLLYSDKRAVSAMTLAEKGKNNLAIDTFSKAEKYFLKIAPLVAEAKRQGVGAPIGFIETLKLSNSKHRELIQILIKDMPTGLSDQLNNVLKLNQEAERVLQKL